jgi:hypothetical protein
MVSMREKRKGYTILIGKRERKGLLGTLRYRWEDNIKMEIKEIN